MNFFGVVYERHKFFPHRFMQYSNKSVKCKNEVLLNHKFTIRVKDERNVTIKPKLYLYIYITLELDNI
jgi:hypothetical protein